MRSLWRFGGEGEEHFWKKIEPQKVPFKCMNEWANSMTREQNHFSVLSPLPVGSSPHSGPWAAYLSVKWGRAAYRLCNWPCLSLTPGLCSGCSTCLEQLSPDISSGRTLCRGEGLGHWVQSSPEERSILFHAVMSPLLQAKCCWPASGTSTQRENLTSETGTCPDKEGYLPARKIQGESDWGLKHLVLDQEIDSQL